ncbi:MAG TPA: hypothetical protein VNJ08_05385 [Bacteriovoracaceae bacterium]|nr:hypothetical protein [Bacteriovoracaceae bacterium]
MNQMIQKKLSSKLLEESLYDLVSRDQYSALLLSGEEKLTGVWSSDEACKVMIRGEVPRSFDFYLTTSGSYPFYYLVQKITENELFDKEVN